MENKENIKCKELIENLKFINNIFNFNFFNLFIEIIKKDPKNYLYFKKYFINSNDKKRLKIINENDINYIHFNNFIFLIENEKLLHYDIIQTIKEL